MSLLGLLMVILVYPYANIDDYDGDRFTVFIYHVSLIAC